MRIGAKTGQVVLEKVPEKVLGGFGAEAGQVQHGFEEGSGEEVPEKVWEALVQSQVRFNRVPEKVAEKAPGSLGAKPSRVQWVPEKVPALGFAARFRKIFKNKTLRLLGRPPKLISFCPNSVIPQQRKLMGPSAQNSSGVHWCRHRVRFNVVPEKVPKVPEKVWDGEGSGEGSVEGLGSFGAEPGQFRRRPGRLWCRAWSASTGSGEGVGGFGAE